MKSGCLLGWLMATKAPTPSQTEDAVLQLRKRAAAGMTSAARKMEMFPGGFRAEGEDRRARRPVVAGWRLRPSSSRPVSLDPTHAGAAKVLKHAWADRKGPARLARPPGPRGLAAEDLGDQPLQLLLSRSAGEARGARRLLSLPTASLLLLLLGHATLLALEGARPVPTPQAVFICWSSPSFTVADGAFHDRFTAVS